MSSKVKVDMRLCDRKTIIEGEAKPDGSVDIHIRSECKDVRALAKVLRNVPQEDYIEMIGSKIYTLAAESHLTPTCLVPVAIFNICWLEVGMISKSLVKKEDEICIHFVE